VVVIDNRRLSLAAKLAGAPLASTAGVDLLVKQGQRVKRGATLFTVHAESPGELDYALKYLRDQKGVIALTPAGENLSKQTA